MINRAYSIFDRKALVYSSPFFALNDSVAARTCTDAVSDVNSSLGRHPGDYVLFLVAQFDDQTGAVVPVSPLVHVCDVLALVPNQPMLPFETDGHTKGQ